jgi:hypothetical protein
MTTQDHIAHSYIYQQHPALFYNKLGFPGCAERRLNLKNTLMISFLRQDWCGRTIVGHLFLFAEGAFYQNGCHSN